MYPITEGDHTLYPQATMRTFPTESEARSLQSHCDRPECGRVTIHYDPLVMQWNVIQYIETINPNLDTL